MPQGARRQRPAWFPSDDEPPARVLPAIVAIAVQFFPDQTQSPPVLALPRRLRPAVVFPDASTLRPRSGFVDGLGFLR